MVTQELIDKIAEGYRQGNRRDAIIQELTGDGWHESDIREGIRQIQVNALSQLPMVGKFTNYIKTFDAKAATLSTRGILILCGAMALIVFFIAVMLYYLLDPLSVRGAARDKQREKDLLTLQQSITKYYASQHVYPSKLQLLTPHYIVTVPSDPRTHQQYAYKILDDQVNYELCIIFETESASCITSAASSVVPTVFPVKPQVTKMQSM